MAEKSNFSIIIAASYASEYLKLCIETLKNNSKLDNEIIIGADYPSWQTLKYLQENNLKHILTTFGHNHMVWNACVKYATRDYVAFIPDDIVFGTYWDVALNELARPNIVGSLMQYDPNMGKNFGYNGTDIKTFNLNEFIRYGSENKKDEYSSGLCCPLLFSKELFWKYYAFTFHTGRAHGHELQLANRILTNEPGTRQIKSLKSFIFHFGHTGNMDRMSRTFLTDDLADSGLLVCAGCHRTWPGFRSDESGHIAVEINRKGFWWCDDCKNKNVMIQNKPGITMPCF